MAKSEAQSHNAYTVLRPLELPHCEEGLHEAFDEQGNSLGMAECKHERGHYGPGHTVHLSAAGAEPFLEAGDLAPAGAEDVEELLVRAHAERLGLSVK